MARTKADSCSRKAVAAKAPRKVVASPASTSKVKVRSGGKTGRYSGGNRYCPRPTPSWQKDIDSFFMPSAKDAAESGCSSSGNESFGSGSGDDFAESGPSDDLNEPGPSKHQDSSDESN